MSDHADTIRRAINDGGRSYTTRSDGRLALDALLAERQQAIARIEYLQRALDAQCEETGRVAAERQQAIDERDRANEAFTAQADLRHAAQVRCEQAIDALREIMSCDAGFEKDIADVALQSLGEHE